MLLLVRILLLSGLLVGQLWRPAFLGQSFPWIDLATTMVVVVAFTEVVRLRLWRRVVGLPHFWLMVALCLSWLVGLAPYLVSGELATFVAGGLYWGRFVLYVACALLVTYLWPRVFTPTGWLAVMGGFLIVGLLQLGLFPDFQIFEHLGWDPHQNRFMGSFLDPNFAAVWMSFGVVLGLYLLTKPAVLTNRILISAATLGLVAGIIMSSSRSGLIALLVGLLVLGFIYARKVAIALLTAATIIVLLTPSLNTKIAGVFSLDTTTRYRLESWEAGLNLLQQQPVIGVGYNTLGSTRYQHALPGTSVLLSQFGNQLGSSLIASNATTGFDGSLLTIFATTGLLGGLVFLWVVVAGMVRSWKVLQRVRSVEYAHAWALWFLAITSSLLISSWFVNAWLYPPILLTWLVVYGLLFTTDSNGNS